MVLVIEELVGRHSDVISGNSINAGCHLSGGHATAICEHLSADILTDAGEVVHLYEDVGLQLVLGACDLFVSHLIHELVDLAQHIKNNRLRWITIRISSINDYIYQPPSHDATQ